MLRVESFAKRLKIFNCSRAYHKHHLIFKQPLKKSKTDEFWVWIPSTAFARLFCRLWWPVFFVSNKARLLSVYHIVHSLLSRLRKPFRYSQISSKFKQANSYTVMTWYFGSLHVKWRLRAQICHHLKFNCVTRACIFLTVFPLKTHTQKGLTGLFLIIVLVVMLGRTLFCQHSYYFWGYDVPFKLQSQHDAVVK